MVCLWKNLDLEGDTMSWLRISFNTREISQHVCEMNEFLGPLTILIWVISYQSLFSNHTNGNPSLWLVLDGQGVHTMTSVLVSRQSCASPFISCVNLESQSLDKGMVVCPWDWPHMDWIGISEESILSYNKTVMKAARPVFQAIPEYHGYSKLWRSWFNS